jgi:flagellar basal-body rod protein FlgF
MASELYVALSGQVALRKRLDTIANNVANMNTVGFRAEEIKFEALVQQAGDNSVDYASTGDSYLSRKAGSLVQTGNPLDVAARGEGWFAVKTPGGVAYTRDGRMQMRESGQLVNLDGYPVLDAGNTPLVLDPTAGPPAIAGDGMISQNGLQVGAVGLFRFDPSAKLARTQYGGVSADKPPTPVLDFTENGIAQGFVENSNVNPVMEMTRLITLTHAFDSVSNMMQSTETSQQDAIKTLGSTS